MLFPVDKETNVDLAASGSVSGREGTRGLVDGGTQ